ncbi:MAG: putative lipid II flippase FtsW, partial [Bacilli bacterium]|nr:putative lipid II flippase FtsW [Bacilli bacterium]
KKEKLVIIFSTSILVLYGLIMIYSSSMVWSEYKFQNKYHYVLYQFIFLIVGLFISKFILKINLDIIKNNINKIFLIGIVLLSLVLIPGIGVVRNGSRSWFSIGPFGFQPSELMKIILIVLTSKYLEKYHLRINKIRENLFPLLFVLFLVVGLIMLEPDFGSSLIIILTFVSMIFVSGLKYRYFSVIGIIGLIASVIMIIIAPYRLMRIISFVDPWKDPLGSGYQIIQSLFAISPGGLFGHGLFSSVQKNFYLPEPQTDFIFSIVCEELGLIGAVILVMLLITLIINIYKVSFKENDYFYKFLSFGIASSIALQSIMNLSVVVGLVPVTGVTLPFFSYGGSSLLTTLVEIALIINIINR